VFVWNDPVQHSEPQRAQQENDPFREKRDHGTRDGDGIIKYFLDFNNSNISSHLEIIMAQSNAHR